ERLPEPAQQHAALFQSDQRIFGIDLKMPRQRRRVDVRERDAVDPPWSSGVGRERSRAKHVEARDGKAFGARERDTPRAPAVAPAIAGAGIEQHAHGCEVDGHARALEAIAVAAPRELAPTVDAAGG